MSNQQIVDPVQAIINELGLKPHPEGGYYIETYRSKKSFNTGGKRRAACTAIYYLLTRDTFSEMHRLSHDEIFHFYLGDKVEMLQLHPDGKSNVVWLGGEVLTGQTPQCIVPAGVWQGSRLAPGGRFALLGCTVSPGFDFADYERGDRTTLMQQYPSQTPMIEALTRTGVEVDSPNR